jgi:uncharacterized protein YjbI with pentapeptide repeats
MSDGSSPAAEAQVVPEAIGDDRPTVRRVLTASELKESLQAGEKDFAWAVVSHESIGALDLSGSTFHCVDFSHSDLSKAAGLSIGSLAGANLDGARVGGLTFDAVLKVVEDSSKNCRTLLLGTVAASAYVALTLLEMTDANLVLEVGSSPLPMGIGQTVANVDFCYVAPIMLVGLYCYLHLYLQRLWERIRVLPAVLPDGRAIDEAIYPWLLSGTARSHLRGLDRPGPAYATAQTIFSFVLGWLVVPLTLYYMWGRALVRHDARLTSFHVAMLALSAVLAYSFYARAVHTLRWVEPAQQRSKRFAPLIRRGAVVVVSIAATAFLSWHPLHGQPLPIQRAELLPGYRPFPRNIDARKQDLSGRNLRGLDLRQANLSETVLTGASLIGARLDGANLSDAALVRVELAGASLVEANLSRARLDYADLTGSNLTGAILSGADLSSAVLARARLQLAKFDGTTFSETRLTDARLEGAWNLVRAQLSGICGRRSVLATLEGSIETSQWIALDPCQDQRRQLREELARKVDAERKEAEAKDRGDRAAAERARADQAAAALAVESAIAAPTPKVATAKVSSARPGAPHVQMGATTVSGRLPPEVIQRVVRQNYGSFRLCYEQGLSRNPTLEGRVVTRFVIGRDGAVSNVSGSGSDIPDSGVVQCVVQAYYGLSFPPPEGGIVTVVYPIMLSPGS